MPPPPPPPLYTPLAIHCVLAVQIRIVVIQPVTGPPLDAVVAIHLLFSVSHFTCGSLPSSQQSKQAEDQQQGVEDVHDGRLPFLRWKRRGEA